MQSAPIPNALSRAFKRRSARVQLKILISVVSGDDRVLHAETTSVSKHGARIRVTSTPARLAQGERLQVAIHHGQNPQAARVVWLDKRSASHYGIEFDEALGNFWGVYFPSKDGGSRSADKKEAPAPVAEASTPAAGQPQAAGQLAVEEQPALTPPAEIGRIPAMIAGLSAIRLPFAEKVELVFTRPQEGTALLQNIVEPGATLRITFAHRITKGYVLAVAGQREAGKWRVRLKCDAASA
ncbi:MAG: PilZ domain-containing protein [Acidobacteriia bacterium]|nr:PilZ domain-containing protein [Terriglobia bacterium]